MSAKYSNSPALHLTVVRSRIRSGLHLALCLLSLSALYLLQDRGYPWLLLLALPLGLLLARLGRQPMAGTQIRWHRGRWRIGRAAALQPVELSPDCTCLPGVIFLAWRERPGGRIRQLWLFADSAHPGELRQLRVRLGLARGIVR